MENFYMEHVKQKHELKILNQIITKQSDNNDGDNNNTIVSN